MLAALMLTLTLTGQEPTADRACRPDIRTDRCITFDDDLRALGMPLLEEEKVAGAEVYRITQIDGYSNLMPGIAYERRTGSVPQIVVYGFNGNKMSATVSPEEWADIKERARYADRTLAPLPGPADPLAGICMHAWSTTVEIVNDSPRGVPNGPARRRTESACNGGLTHQFGFVLPSLAIKHFPECDLLDRKDYRNDMTRLGQCASFKGDRLAAAGLMNQVGGRFVPDDAEDRALAWARRLQPGDATRLDWAGQVTSGGGGARSPVALFMADFQTQNPSLRGYISTLDAVSSTRVEATGRMDMDGPEGANDTRLTAPFTQTWLWDPNSLAWSLDTWIVQPFAPVR